MARTNITCVEVSPVAFFEEDGEELAIATTPRNADAWGVYLRLSSGMAEWVSDHRTKKTAMRVAGRLGRKYGVDVFSK